MNMKIVEDNLQIFIGKVGTRDSNASKFVPQDLKGCFYFYEVEIFVVIKKKYLIKLHNFINTTIYKFISIFYF